ncbi:MAG: sigma-54 dependent transcriptional regulator [Candidatus Margulisbacteria bacterium]|nr:sigma-54 dependent transcriptional regulator [Candidatus Margulisiibacteriota bacterium]
MHKILVVDDELSIRESFSLILTGLYQVQTAASGEAALKIISGQKFDLAFLDIRMPGLDGLETLKKIKEIDPNLEIIMVTAVNDMRKASEAIKLGARDYVIKPFDVNQILKLIEKILLRKSLLGESHALLHSFPLKCRDLIGQSEKFLALLETAAKMKGSQPVLILGEMGTEKETLAEFIHNSSLSKGIFLKLVLSSEMPPQKIKALLFGQEKGSNVVELQGQSGLLELAKGGTLYIENLDALPAEISKILPSGQFIRNGGTASLPIEARIIASACPDFASKNQFLAEFFDSHVLSIPPLRERLADIPLIIDRLLEKFSTIYKTEHLFTPAAREALANYLWPGNVLELESVIERIFLTAPVKEIDVINLPIDILLSFSSGAGGNFLPAFEEGYVQKIFKKNHSDKDKTAAILGVNPAFLESRIAVGNR